MGTDSVIADIISRIRQLDCESQYRIISLIRESLPASQEKETKDAAKKRFVECVNVMASLGYVLRPGRDAVSACIRHCIAYRMEQEGFTEVSIAIAMAKHHSTVNYSKQVMIGVIANPSSYRELYNMYVKFTNELYKNN